VFRFLSGAIKLPPLLNTIALTVTVIASTIITNSSGKHLPRTENKYFRIKTKIIWRNWKRDIVRTDVAPTRYTSPWINAISRLVIDNY
jgi:hypothetical protein